MRFVADGSVSELARSSLSHHVQVRYPALTVFTSCGGFALVTLRLLLTFRADYPRRGRGRRGRAPPGDRGAVNESETTLLLPDDSLEETPPSGTSTRVRQVHL